MAFQPKKRVAVRVSGAPKGREKQAVSKAGGALKRMGSALQRAAPMATSMGAGAGAGPSIGATPSLPPPGPPGGAGAGGGVPPGFKKGGRVKAKKR